MSQWYPGGPPPEERSVWDAERGLSFGVFYTRDATVHWLYEGLELVARFDGNDWSSRSLTPQERVEWPGHDELAVWSITSDWGAGACADTDRRRAMIVALLNWRTARMAERLKSAPLARRWLPWAEVRFDVPFVGR